MSVSLLFATCSDIWHSRRTSCRMSSSAAQKSRACPPHLAHQKLSFHGIRLWREVLPRFSSTIPSWTPRKRKAQRCNKIDWPSVGAIGPTPPDVPVSCS
jgi:hypothetical protein